MLLTCLFTWKTACLTHENRLGWKCLPNTSLNNDQGKCFIMLTLDVSAKTVTAPWIVALSKGGLVIPSQQFLCQIYEMETIFSSLHGNSISSAKNITKAFFKLCATRFPDVSPDVLKKFVRTRTFVRIRFLNSQLKLGQVVTFFKQYTNSLKPKNML